MLNKCKEVKSDTRFYKVDLHIHTPASLDYGDKMITPEQIVTKAIENKLDLIAITDHNTVDKCYDVIKAAKNSKLVVLPGVEISGQGGTQGIHVLALFDYDAPKDRILNMLDRIGITFEKKGKYEALTECQLTVVLDEIQKAGGIAIAAHADQTRGLIHDLGDQQLTTIVHSIKLYGLEVVHKETSQAFDGTNPNYKRKLSCIQNSDAHSLSEIGCRTTNIRMDKPSLEGLRKAFLNQELRIE